jgi:large subunit ribosomal protein L3
MAQTTSNPGLVGRKVGMTRIFTEDGASIPVTVIEVQSNRVTQVKRSETDGYDAIQVTTGARSANRINRPEAGHFARAGVEAGRGLWELRIEPSAFSGDLEVGREFTVGGFVAGERVDATGISIGKGFAGVIKRHHFSSQDATHGNSLAHRAPGSIGQNQTPGRVFKGKKMAGHLGNVRRTVQNLEVVRIDEDRGLLLVRGAVPGPKGGNVVVRPSVKAPVKSGNGS